MTDSASSVESRLYVSRVRVRPGEGPDKLVTLPSESSEIVMGAHGALAQRLGVPESHVEHAATLDYLVAAIAACLSGTLVRALKARGVSVDASCYGCDARGEIMDRQGLLLLEQVSVQHKMRIPRQLHEIAEHVHRIYDKGCAVSRSVAGAIRVESTLVLE